LTFFNVLGEYFISVIVASSQYQIYKKFPSVKMSKWHAHAVHMAKNMNMVGGPGPGPLAPLNPAMPDVDKCSLVFQLVNRYFKEGILE